jgi:ribosomal protein L29
MESKELSEMTVEEITLHVKELKSSIQNYKSLYEYKGKETEKLREVLNAIGLVYNNFKQL